MSFENLMNSSADMKRPIADYDDMGGVIYNLTTFSAGHFCRISESVPVEVSAGPSEWAEASAMVYTLPGTEFQRDDEVHQGSKVYVVLGVKTPSVSEHHTTLVCKVQTDGS